MPRPRKPASPFRYLNSSPEVIRLVVMMYVRFPLSLRNVEDLLFEHGIDLCHETERMWWNLGCDPRRADCDRRYLRYEFRAYARAQDDLWLFHRAGGDRGDLHHALFPLQTDEVAVITQTAALKARVSI